jgi:tryptophanyl-tRNA synthetase
MTKKSRVLSGIQPTSGVTLGNYLGAIRNWVDGQSEKDNLFCVVDLHAHTVPQKPEELRANTRELAAMLLACGIDPKRSILFIQSHVPYHTEVAWLLNCVTPLGWLNKMTQFKDKSAKQESIMTGLLTYPVLMAADILIYSANEVPVGEDQKQHVELARNIAEKFNHQFGDTLVVPTPVIPKLGARIMGLDDPLTKMSKSNAHKPGHAVFLADSDDLILKNFKRATTDSGNEIRFSEDPEKAGVNNLLTIYAALTSKQPEDAEKDFENARGYGDLKIKVAEVVIEKLKPIKEKYQELINDVTGLDAILKNGAEAAVNIAAPLVSLMKERMGFLR